MSLTHGTTANEGCTLHFTTILPSTEEAPKKPLLILVPGGSGHSTQFLPMLPYFASKFQPATYSRRQHGLSTPEPGTSEVYLNIAQQARDLLAVASALGFGTKQLDLFCSSGGGIVAFQLAVSYPNRIAPYDLPRSRYRRPANGLGKVYRLTPPSLLPLLHPRKRSSLQNLPPFHVYRL